MQPNATVLHHTSHSGFLKHPKCKACHNYHKVVFSCLSRLGTLTQYKEKAAKLREVPLGLFIYPVLQVRFTC